MQRVLSRQSTFDQALVDFERKVHDLTRNAVDGRSYILVETLQIWMRDPSLTKLETKFVTNTDLLAHAAYYGRHDFPPIKPSRICEPGQNCCLIVFSILLNLELGYLIDVFARKDILDRRLPEDLASLKQKLKKLENGEQIAERFNERQWRYCPAMFSLDMEGEYFESRIIPICRKFPIGHGGTARVDQIVVQAEFVDKSLRNKLQDDRDAFVEDPEYGPCFIFALKTFEPDSFQYYFDEKAAFDGLRGNRGVIRHLGCYSHQIVTPNMSNNGQPQERQAVGRLDTMNLLLEYGTYDLRLIFFHRLPPVLAKEILAFWQALFELADAMHGIHEFKAGGYEFNGWHADIKPENIIYVRGKYKLADPGFARFKKVQDKGTLPRAPVRGGTNTYGAPEVLRQATVHQTIDTWSLGCVFSMAATWIIMGYQGIRQYQIVREKALATMLKSIREDDHPLLTSHRLKANAKPGKLDCFHNGVEALEEVTSWHKYLRDSVRKTDPITEAVLDLIDKKMLLGAPEGRINSGDLCEELKRIVTSAKKTTRDSAMAESHEAQKRREHLEVLLKEIDDQAIDRTVDEEPHKPTQLLSNGFPIDKRALEVPIKQEPLMKTSHRFETLPEPRPNQAIRYSDMESLTPFANETAGLGIKELSYVDQVRPGSASATPKHASMRRSTFGYTNRTNTGYTAATQRKNTSRSPSNSYQNVVQAREIMDRESKRVSLGSVPFIKRRRKDEYLSKHFRKRDIKYLIDDANTMADHWDEATFLLETLVMKAHGQDPDGPDLLFMNHSAELREQQNVRDFRKAMQAARPDKNGNVQSNIKNALQSIFNNYLEKVSKSSYKSSINALTIIVLTDGLWRGMNDQNEVIEKIEHFYQQLEKKMQGMMQERQVSIQFIQFGDDEQARERLRRLDDDMPFRGIGDMIDHERFSITGNVYKMLLGSFVEAIDAEDDIDEPTSPEAHNTTTLGFISEEPQEMPGSSRVNSSLGQAGPNAQDYRNTGHRSKRFSAPFF